MDQWNPPQAAGRTPGPEPDPSFPGWRPEDQWRAQPSPPPHGPPPVTRDRARPARRRWLLIAGSVLAVLLIVTGAVTVVAWRANRPKAAKQVAGPPTPSTLSPPPTTLSPPPSTVNDPALTGGKVQAKNQGSTRIGQPVTYDDGMEVKITRLWMTQPGKFSSAPKGSKILVADVQVTNRTGAYVDLTLLSVKVRMGPEQRQGEQSFDSEAVPPRLGDLLHHGRVATGSYGFTVSDPGDIKQITLEVQVNLDHQAAVFEGSL